jgi:hypothetical protein
MTFDGTCERGGFQRAPQEIEKTPPGTSTEAQKQGIRLKLEIGNLGRPLLQLAGTWGLGSGPAGTGAYLITALRWCRAARRLIGRLSQQAARTRVQLPPPPASRPARTDPAGRAAHSVGAKSPARSPHRGCFLHLGPSPRAARRVDGDKPTSKARTAVLAVS